jgi:hypothetical protein
MTTLKTILLTNDQRVVLDETTAFELEDREADALMFAGVIFFCRHHTDMVAERDGGAAKVLCFHAHPAFETDRLIEAIKRGREKLAQDEATHENAPADETTKPLDLSAWGFAPDGEPKVS